MSGGVAGGQDEGGHNNLQLSLRVPLVHLKDKAVQRHRGTGRVTFRAVLWWRVVINGINMSLRRNGTNLTKLKTIEEEIVDICFIFHSLVLSKVGNSNGVTG